MLVVSHTKGSQNARRPAGFLRIVRDTEGVHQGEQEQRHPRRRPRTGHRLARSSPPLHRSSSSPADPSQPLRRAPASLWRDSAPARHRCGIDNRRDAMSAATRRHDLDALRVGTFLLLLLYHLGMFYVSWDWHVKSNHILPGLEPWMGVLNPWRLSPAVRDLWRGDPVHGRDDPVGRPGRPALPAPADPPRLRDDPDRCPAELGSRSMEKNAYGDASFLDFWPRYPELRLQLRDHPAGNLQPPLVRGLSVGLHDAGHRAATVVARSSGRRRGC